MNRSPYDEEVETYNLQPAAPAIVWGALMAVALVGAAATVMRSSGQDRQERLVASDDRSLQSEVAKLSTERDELAGRLASLERSFGQFRLASRAAGAPETTGSIARPQQSAAATTPGTVPYVVVDPADAGGPIGVLIGHDGTTDEIRRRWSSLASRYPQQLGKLSPRIQRTGGGTGLVSLVAGPFASRADADRACTTLADAGLACDTTGYAGDPIGRP
ncbi:SPOR domain-containing protein [Chenggangzhangella methanolivorans]|uniref:SPOR domain-containing protein n=1 Tax=Chenggangzhangella methanolivorans TaxID=1437009 RepID=A0A9E6UMG9_9HYPH|nr:SPOR domain-containing protein [Chenggangzhangella methanolivorans]QZO00016.1 SPOR domain-containing protein [Chenggangzhangella methanolivorans]